jgi:hypothetical protein
MHRNRLYKVFIVICVFASSSTAQNSPHGAVEQFYRFDGTHSQIFNRRNIDARRRWFTDTLYYQLRNELKRQIVFERENPGAKPHFGDGLPFRPWDETCQSGIGPIVILFLWAAVPFGELMRQCQ